MIAWSTCARRIARVFSERDFQSEKTISGTHDGGGKRWMNKLEMFEAQMRWQYEDILKMRKKFWLLLSSSSSLCDECQENITKQCIISLPRTSLFFDRFTWSSLLIDIQTFNYSEEILRKLIKFVFSLI